MNDGGMTTPHDRSLRDLLAALRFAADKHHDQRRKGHDASPYINHSIAVAEVIARCGVTDVTVLQAAILHDTIEDTKTTPEELERAFGPEVAGIVGEVTDDKALPKDTRKRLQEEHAPRLSEAARLVKIADKICNVVDVTHSPAVGWDMKRRLDYLDWTERVVKGCRGVNQELERIYDDVLRGGREHVLRSRPSS